MEDVLGVIGLVVFVAAVIALAAGMTWAVIKISPSRDRPKKAAEPSS
jgi:hypothetical protein